MVKEWKKEIARDCMALGSVPFYFIVIIRAIIGKYMPFVYELLIALIVLIVLSRIKLKFNPYIARCFVLFVFTSLFYKEILYTIFAFLLWVCVVIASYYLKVKKREIIMGILFGIVSSAISYYLSSLLK